MKLSKKQRAHLKEVIEEVEYYSNGFNKFCDGRAVQAINIKVSKVGERVEYDAVLHRPFDSPTKERYDDCWMSFDTIIKNAKQLGVNVSFLTK